MALLSKAVASSASRLSRISRASAAAKSFSFSSSPPLDAITPRSSASVAEWRSPLGHSTVIRSSAHVTESFGKRFSATASGCILRTQLDYRRSFSTGTSSLPIINDSDVKYAFKELLALGWDEIPNGVIKNVKKALAKTTEDKAGQKVLLDVFRAAEASVEFSAMLVNIRMALEERTGMIGDNVAELPEELMNAILVAYKRYIAYVNSFSAEETYLRKKVETELGTRLIHLKQRVSGLGSEWGEINVIGTSGLSGSYVEHRA